MRSNKGLMLVLGAMVSCLPLSAQEMKGSDILEKVEQQIAGVRDFTANLEVDVDMNRLRMPRMKATMYFKQPDKVHFDAPDFAMLPREGIFMNPRLLRERYDIVLSGAEAASGTTLYRLQLAAKEISARIRQMYLFVDASNWTIARMEMAPFPGRVATFEFVYSRHQEKYWLPDRMVASFSTAEKDTTLRLPDLAQEMSPRQAEMRGGLRSGSITVTYTKYRINTNLSDDIFSRKDKE